MQPPHKPPNPSSLLLRTTKMCSHGCVFTVHRLSSVLMGMFLIFAGSPSPSPPADTWMHFWCLHALFHPKSRNTPPWVCFCFFVGSPPLPHHANTWNASTGMCFRCWLALCSKPEAWPMGAMFLVSAASSACAEQCGVFLVFSPFLGNFLLRYILFRYIYGVIDIIIYLFELFYLVPF